MPTQPSAYALVGSQGTVNETAQAAANTPAYGQSPTATNLLILWVAGAGATTQPGTPAGWSLGLYRATGTSSTTIFYKIAAGGDAAPTVAGLASVFLTCRLGEFGCGATAGPLDTSGGANGLTSPQTATHGAADARSGELQIICATGIYSVGATEASFNVTSNHATVVETDDKSTSQVHHYSFAYGITTSNSGADTATLTYTATNITGAGLISISFKLGLAPPSPTVVTQAVQRASFM